MNIDMNMRNCQDEDVKMKRSRFYILAWQLTGVLSIIAWTGTLSILLFGSLRLMRIFRVSEDVEKKGLDITRHGQHAYPAEAYGYSHLHIMTVGDQGKVSPIDQGYVNKIFVTYEGHELTETKASTIRTIHSVPSIVEMESLDTELSGIQKEHKAKQLKPLLWMNDTIEKR